MHAGESADGALRRRDLRVDKKGDDRSRHRNRPGDRARVPRADRRALSRSRRARRGVREQRDREDVPEYCWVFDPVDGTTNYAHGLPIFCSSLALEIRGEPAVAAIYDPNRRELFTAERGQGAWLNGAPLEVSARRPLIDSLLVHRLPLQRPARSGRARGPVREVHHDVARGAPARVGGARPLLRRGRAVRWLLGAVAPSVGRRRRRADRAGSGRARDRLDGGPYSSRRGSVIATNGHVHEEMLEIIRSSGRAWKA